MKFGEAFVRTALHTSVCTVSSICILMFYIGLPFSEAIKAEVFIVIYFALLNYIFNLTYDHFKDKFRESKKTSTKKTS